jgi:hypothetical protein
VFSGELDASSPGLSGYQIGMLCPNARNVVFQECPHGQADLADLPPQSVNDYRACAPKMATRFLADPKSELDTHCAETGKLRLVR